MSSSSRKPPVRANGVTYRWPSQPLVVICIDGGDPTYFERGLADGLVPNIERFASSGFWAIADGTMPSFTCPNNISLVTGVPASVHGISGNFYLDPATDEAVVMTGPELLRAETVLAAFERAGARVAFVTAKDKLRRQIGKGLDPGRGSVCFSAERAHECTRAENGLDDALDYVGAPRPGLYSMELSLFVLDAGIRLLERNRPDIMYLSLTDWVQHKYAPGTPEASRFYRLLDQRVGRLVELGADVALTADHGMSDKSRPDGTPNVIWLQDLLDKEFGAKSTRVICPITDAFVGHHGSLGGFVRVYCRDGRALPGSVREFALQLPGVSAALERDEVCDRYALPPDREGDVAVIAEAPFALGAGVADHDLSALGGQRLRSHGGLSEARVPFVLGRKLNPAYAERAALSLKSYELFDFALNGIA